MNNNKLELIVAIPSYMEADSIGFVTKQVDNGISKYYDKLKSIIINDLMEDFSEK